MKRNRTTKRSFSKSIRWTLLLAAAVSLLSAQLSGAAILCFCGPPQSEADSCQCEHHCASSAGTHGESGALSNALESHTGATVSDMRGNQAVPSSLSCCHGRQGAEAAVATVSFQKPDPVKGAPPPSGLDAPTTLASASIDGDLHNPRSRPLYIALSSLLI